MGVVRETRILAFDRTKEPKFGTKVKVIKTASLFNAVGIKQNGVQNANTEVTVFEAKEISGKVYYRIGGQNQWIEKTATNWQIDKPQPVITAEKKTKESRFTKTNLSEDILSAANQDQMIQVTQPKKDIEKYDLAVKKGLALQKGSSVPSKKEIRKIFKDGKKFPAATKFEWVYEPDTAQNKYTNAKVKVIFPDGSFKEHSVHYNILIPNKPKIQQTNPSLNKQAAVAQPVNQGNSTTVKFVNSEPQDLNFSFIKTIPLLAPFLRNMDEALRLYQQAYYKQMSNTIRQGLELLTDQLLKLNQINPGYEWQNANLSNQLGYIAFLKILPQRIMNLCFSIKNYGNIGSHHNTVAQFNQASALTDLQQYHDLLAYLANTYQNNGQKIVYADVQLTDEQSKHRNWYQRPRINSNYLTFAQYLNRKNNPVQRTQPVPKKTQPPVVPAQNPKPAAANKEKMGKGMKTILGVFALIGIALLCGIGYEVYHMYNKPAQNYAVNQSSGTTKQQAQNLNRDQQVALSILYANLKLDPVWQEAYNSMTDNGDEVERYSQYKFGNATVSVQGNNYIYVLEKEVGFGFKDENGGRTVSFFTSDSNNTATIYQMYKAIKKAGYADQINRLAKKIKYKNIE